MSFAVPTFKAKPWGRLPGRPWPTWEGNGRPPAVSEQHAAARYWAARGLPVCRLIARGKRPTDKAPKTTGAGPEHRLAISDLNVIDEWWLERHPRWGPRALCNPGLPTGPWPGFVALDVDRPQVFESWVGERSLPPTLRWSSRRPDQPQRYTLLFKYPNVRFVVRSAIDGSRRCVPGVDLRAAGEHVVLPGALHPQGTVYAIQRNVAVGALPAWLVAELADRFGPRQSARLDPGAGSRPALTSAMSNAVPPHPGLRRQAYGNALRLFGRAAATASAVPGRRHHMLVGLAWEGLARGLCVSDVRRVLVARYVNRACPEDEDRISALSQLEEALAQPRRATPNQPRFSVSGQERWLLARASRRWVKG